MAGKRREWPTEEEVPGSSSVPRAIVLEIVDNQLRNDDPPGAKAVYHRLRVEGYSDEESRKLIGCVVLTEVHGILASSDEFDQERYIGNLNRLPALPWEDDE